MSRRDLLRDSRLFFQRVTSSTSRTDEYVRPATAAEGGSATPRGPLSEPAERFSHGLANAAALRRPSFTACRKWMPA